MIEHPEARLSGPGVSLSPQEWTERSSALAASLEEGDRLAILTSSSTSTAVALRAARSRGLSACLIDARLPADQREERLRQSGATLVVADDLDGCSRLGPPGTPDPSAGLGVFTSGTTGHSRLARLSWAALDASASGVVSATSLGPGDCWHSPLPLSHVGGVGVVLRCLRSGATADLAEAFEPGALLALIRSGRVTHLSLVSRMLERLLAEACDDLGSSELRWVLVGGGATPLDLLQRARREGLPVVSTYGLTEAGSTVTLHRPDEVHTGDGDAGWPLPHQELKILEPDSSGLGEIALRGPALAACYGEGEDLLREGWLHTGDWGRIGDDGRLSVVDRRQDLIVSGGENVSPAELERRLLARPEVEEVCILGLPDPSWGQQVVAVLRLVAEDRGESESMLRDLQGWCSRELPAWERPRRWELHEEPLPRTALGKLRRAALRASLRSGESSD